MVLFFMIIFGCVVHNKGEKYNIAFEKCDDDWWIVYDNSNFGERNKYREVVYLCDGIDGLKLLQSMMATGKMDIDEKMWG